MWPCQACLGEKRAGLVRVLLPASASVVEEAIGGLAIATVKDVVAAEAVGAEAIGGLAIASV